MSVINPPIDDLLAKVDSKYTLCIIAAKCSQRPASQGVGESGWYHENLSSLFGLEVFSCS